MQAVYYVVPSVNDLQHHGVLGMHWGIRRYQPYSVVPRGSGEGGKEIGLANKAAKKNVKSAYNNIRKNIGKVAKYEDTNRIYKNKINKNKEKGNLEKVSKLESKRNNYISKHKEQYDNSVKVLHEGINEIDKATKQLGEKQVNKIINSEYGKTVLKGAVARTGLAMFGIIAYGGDPGNGRITKDYINMKKQGTENKSDKPAEYKITEKPKKEPSNNERNSQYSKGLNDSQKKRMDNAIKNDKYDLTFLEAIQNSKILDDGNTHEILKEYNAYLKDPDNYWDRGRKLKGY